MLRSKKAVFKVCLRGKTLLAKACRITREWGRSGCVEGDAMARQERATTHDSILLWWVMWGDIHWHLHSPRSNVNKCREQTRFVRLRMHSQLVSSSCRVHLLASVTLRLFGGSVDQRHANRRPVWTFLFVPPSLPGFVLNYVHLLGLASTGLV